MKMTAAIELNKKKVSKAYFFGVLECFEVKTTHILFQVTPNLFLTRDGTNS